MPTPRRPEPLASLYRLQGAALAETAAGQEIVVWRETQASAGSRSGQLRAAGPWFVLLSPPNVMNLDDFDTDIVYTGMGHVPAGADRIVVVRILSTLTNEDPVGKVSLSLRSTVMTPATRTLAPRVVGRANQVSVFLTPLLDLRTLYTGQSDPSDPAVFSIKLEHGVSTSILRGKLTADDAVTWLIAPGGSATLAQDTSASKGP